MIALGKMIRLTPTKIRKNAIGVKIKVISSQFGQTPDKTDYMEVLIKAKSNKPSKDGKIKVHTVIIRQYGTSKIALASTGIRSNYRSWVHCNCEHFLFSCEYALTRYGSSSIINSNGDPAVVTNPKNIPMVCKHLIAVAAIRPRLNLPDLPEIDPVKLEVMQQSVTPTKTEQKLMKLLGPDEDEL